MQKLELLVFEKRDHFLHFIDVAMMDISIPSQPLFSPFSIFSQLSDNPCSSKFELSVMSWAYLLVIQIIINSFLND